MEHSIYKLQSEKKNEIKKIVEKHKGSEKWEKARKAFHEMIRTYVHGGIKNMSDEALDKHFERALFTTKKDIRRYLDLAKAPKPPHPKGKALPLVSPYYMVEVAHDRHDKFFEPDQPCCPITGTGNQTFESQFTAKNLFQRATISADNYELPRVDDRNPFPTWDSIVEAMTDRTIFDNNGQDDSGTFYFTDPADADAIFEVANK